MATLTKPQKVECLNPNTGRRMSIDKPTYDLISKAIYHTLTKEGPITFTQMAEGVHECLAQQKVQFSGSVEWYTVTIKNDMHARGVIEVYSEKGNKLHRIKK